MYAKKSDVDHISKFIWNITRMDQYIRDFFNYPPCNMKSNTVLVNKHPSHDYCQIINKLPFSLYLTAVESREHQ